MSIPTRRVKNRSAEPCHYKLTNHNVFKRFSSQKHSKSQHTNTRKWFFKAFRYIHNNFYHNFVRTHCVIGSPKDTDYSISWFLVTRSVVNISGHSSVHVGSWRTVYSMNWEDLPTGRCFDCCSVSTVQLGDMWSDTILHLWPCIYLHNFVYVWILLTARGWFRESKSYNKIDFSEFRLERL